MSGIRVPQSLVLALAAAIASSGVLKPAYAADARAGERFAQENCSRCHAIGRAGGSPLANAPPLRTIARKYKLQDLEEGLAEGIVTGHNIMPEFTLTPPQIDDLLAYLRRLKAR
ncbi:MAG: c-type cytochrome [Methylocystis sp.]|jgi:cytochrome c|nr:c-type cytochrome [Methylocystis sp.]MCA3585071.1 c-type cytochrome [Methylocystis sp.]MCA3587788.1 c-type cytochrome [Methylocystis sp.]MCA3592289.1 c-type cytochrome [Methylocystis sp.]